MHSSLADGMRRRGVRADQALPWADRYMRLASQVVAAVSLSDTSLRSERFLVGWHKRLAEVGEELETAFDADGAWWAIALGRR